MRESRSDDEPVNGGDPGEAPIGVVGLGDAGCRLVGLAAEGLPAQVRLAAINTDSRALADSRVPVRLQIGAQRTHGFGGASEPGLGRLSAQDDVELLRNVAAGCCLVIVVVGLGGGTGSGAAPVLLRAAVDAGATVLCLATMPFSFEGDQRRRVAEEALTAIREACDSVIVVPNDRLVESVGASDVAGTFHRANRVLAAGVEALCNLLVRPGYIQLSFSDLGAVLREAGGCCTLGFGEGRGGSRVRDALAGLLDGPMLKRGELLGGGPVVLGILGGPDLTLQQVGEVTEAVRDRAGRDARVMVGTYVTDSLTGRLCAVALVAEARGGTLATKSAPSNDDERARRSAPRRAAREKSGQRELQLDEAGQPGRFKNTEPTILDGENLDIPTFRRRNIVIER